MTSKCYVIVWELGFGTSYLSFIRMLSETITQSGNRCVVICKDPGLAQRFISDPNVSVLEAPAPATYSESGVKTQTSYASLLFNNGFHSSTALARRISAWNALFATAGADFIFARHSPTAIIAARTLGLPVLHYGNSFSVPPPSAPWPSFRPDLIVGQQTLIQNELRMTRLINRALNTIGGDLIGSVQDIYAELPTALLDYPALDWFGGHRETKGTVLKYLGFPDLNFGPAPTWPGRRAVKVFLSLLPSSDKNWASVLTDLGAEVLLRVRDTAITSEETRSPEFVSTTNDGHLNFAQAIRECDYVVGYGSHNLVCEALLAGKPVAVIAHSADELLLGKRVESLGVGIMLSQTPSADGTAYLRRHIHSGRLKENAEAFALNHSTYSRTDIAVQLLSLATNLPFNAYPAEKVEPD